MDETQYDRDDGGESEFHWYWGADDPRLRTHPMGLSMTDDELMALIHEMIDLDSDEALSSALGQVESWLADDLEALIQRAKDHRKPRALRELERSRDNLGGARA
ncbi:MULTISPECIES: hypothetical protein [unclassified Thioalkalivibrio]|uniref:hypothetical protein n=1 Tax=unclassified Thioalkalivibrio TaxID=2621013 RepID=UPI00036ECC59|nr:MULTISPECIES: hypothetical protein [unclassified Thioalkalivibrio]